MAHVVSSEKQTEDQHEVDDSSTQKGNVDASLSWSESPTAYNATQDKRDKEDLQGTSNSSLQLKENNDAPPSIIRPNFLPEPHEDNAVNEKLFGPSDREDSPPSESDTLLSQVVHDSYASGLMPVSSKPSSGATSITDVADLPATATIEQIVSMRSSDDPGIQEDSEDEVPTNNLERCSIIDTSQLAGASLTRGIAVDEYSVQSATISDNQKVGGHNTRELKHQKHPRSVLQRRSQHLSISSLSQLQISGLLNPRLGGSTISQSIQSEALFNEPEPFTEIEKRMFAGDKMQPSLSHEQLESSTILQGVSTDADGETEKFERQLTKISSSNSTDVDDSQLSLYDDGREHQLSEMASLDTSSRTVDLAEVSETPAIADEPSDAQLHLHAPVLDAAEFTLPYSSEASAAGTTSDIKRDRNEVRLRSGSTKATSTPRFRSRRISTQLGPKPTTGHKPWNPLPNSNFAKQSPTKVRRQPVHQCPNCVLKTVFTINSRQLEHCLSGAIMDGVPVNTLMEALCSSLRICTIEDVQDTIRRLKWAQKKKKKKMSSSADTRGSASKRSAQAHIRNASRNRRLHHRGLNTD